ncbi:MAG: hypothetical protein GY839_02545 [candidate division Zixibacteria bacterium]|nr:hypothetical protein [candidate division Zixibacteria bacterium]
MLKISIFTVISLLAIFALGCNNIDNSLNPPFGLEWGMSFSEVTELIKGNNIDELGVDKSPYQYGSLTHGVLLGEYLGNDRFVEIYFWNDSLFALLITQLEFTFFDDSTVFIPYPSIEESGAMALPDLGTYDSSDSAINTESNHIRILDDELLSLWIDMSIDSLNTYILDSNISKIVNTDRDTIYADWGDLVNVYFHECDPCRMLVDRFNYFGYYSSNISIDICSSNNEITDPKTASNRRVRISYKSLDYLAIEKKIMEWEKENNDRIIWQKPL